MPEITYTVGALASVAAGNITPVPPGGLVAQDYLIMFVVQTPGGGPALATVDPAWRLIEQRRQALGYVEVAAWGFRYNGVLPSFEVSGAVNYKRAVVISYRGCSEDGDPVDSEATSQSAGASPITLPSIVNSTRWGKQVILFALHIGFPPWIFDSTVTYPAGWTTDIQGVPFSDGAFISVASRSQEASGESGAQAVAYTWASDGQVCAIMFNLVPKNEIIPVSSCYVCDGKPVFGAGNLAPELPPRRKSSDVLVCLCLTKPGTTATSMPPGWTHFISRAVEGLVQARIDGWYRRYMGAPDPPNLITIVGSASGTARMIGLRYIGDPIVHSETDAYAGLVNPFQVDQLNTTIETHNVAVLLSVSSMQANFLNPITAGGNPSFALRLRGGWTPNSPGGSIRLYDGRQNPSGLTGTRNITAFSDHSFTAQIAFGPLDFGGGGPCPIVGSGPVIGGGIGGGGGAGAGPGGGGAGAGPGGGGGVGGGVEGGGGAAIGESEERLPGEAPRLYRQRRVSPLPVPEDRETKGPGREIVDRSAWAESALFWGLLLLLLLLLLLNQTRRED